VYCRFEDLQDENLELRKERDRLYRLLQEQLDKCSLTYGPPKFVAVPTSTNDDLTSKLRETERDLLSTKTQLLQVLPLKLRLRGLSEKLDTVSAQLKQERVQGARLHEVQASWDVERLELVSENSNLKLERLSLTSSLESVLLSRTGRNHYDR
jgi:hypothetical protein